MIGEEQESETSQKETGEEGKIVACNLRSEVTKGLFTLWNKWKFSFGNTDEHNLGGSLFILDNKKKKNIIYRYRCKKYRNLYKQVYFPGDTLLAVI